MYDLIPPYGTLNDVLPGTPWQPESAARYNAVNELLKQEPRPLTETPFVSPAADTTVKVCNASEKMLSVSSIVQLDTGFINDENYIITRRNSYLFGKSVEQLNCFWGIALDNIPPGQWGSVQISGIAVVDPPRGEYESLRTSPYGKEPVRNNFVFAGTDGALHFGTRGEAQVLSYCPGNRKAIIRLGVSSPRYTGMFAVLENGDGTLTVKGGETDLVSSDVYQYFGGAFIGDTQLPAENRGSVICLVAKYKNLSWQLSVEQFRDSTRDIYIPGEQIFIELARYYGVDEWGYLRDFQQLWQGGMVRFKERYFVE